MEAHTNEFQDVSVTYDLEVILSEIQTDRPMRLKHRTYVTTPDVVGERILQLGPQRVDPFKLMMIYCQHEGLRLWDLFAKFDKDGSMKLSRSEFTEGIRVSNINHQWHLSK